LGSKDSTVYIGMNWAALNNTPFADLNTSRTRAASRRRYSALAWYSQRATARKISRHLIDLMATVVEISGEVSGRVQRQSDHSNGRASSLPPSTANRSSAPNYLF
jgi:hypothetical protein